MKVKSIIVSLIAVLLLSISCTANACGAFCELKMLGPGCHGASPARAADATVAIAAMDAMAGSECGPHMTDMTPKAAQVDASNPCRHTIFAQSQQAIAGDPTALTSQPLAFRPLDARPLASEQALLSGVLKAASLRHRRVQLAHPSAERGSLQRALQTTLRV